LGEARFRRSGAAFAVYVYLHGGYEGFHRERARRPVQGEIALCGTKSGRNTNKIEACGFTLEKGVLVGAPYIGEADVHYECRTVQKTSVINADLDGGIVKEYYPKGDYHRVYFGEILGVYRR
jgi:flavin reductase (DIM6/NTAB) family NADH-FMN oxidoreductase RutF